MASLGGGAIIAFAAVLWLLYLTPTWLRRREYVRTERTAVRLQQTLRVLAETAEVPEEVRAEVSARSVAEQHRALRESARRAETVARPREAKAERTLARSGGGPREPRSRALAVSDIAAARLRRSRVLATNVLVVGITLAGLGRLRRRRGRARGSSSSPARSSPSSPSRCCSAPPPSRPRTAPSPPSTRRSSCRRSHAASRSGRRPSRPARPGRRCRCRSPATSTQQKAAAVAPAKPVRDDVAIAASLRAAAQRADDALRAAHAAPEVAALDRRPVDAVNADERERPGHHGPRRRPPPPPLPSLSEDPLAETRGVRCDRSAAVSSSVSAAEQRLRRRERLQLRQAGTSRCAAPSRRATERRLRLVGVLSGVQQREHAGRRTSCVAGRGSGPTETVASASRRWSA